MAILPNRKNCERARRTRDARFDGLFFTAVRTTGIYCRSICPANPPLEKNVEYHNTAISAAQAGFRPCLRCRPDSAPQSYAWRGSHTSFQRALQLIQQGVLQTDSVSALATRLGISDRYLRELFNIHLGTSPKKYAIYQQCLFAKQLLHDSTMPITQVAFAAGFNSVRRFNEAMQQQLGLAPRAIRGTNRPAVSDLKLKLYYRPPYAWTHCHHFLGTRALMSLEWLSKESYSRTICYQDRKNGMTKGYFSIKNMPDKNYLELTVHLDNYKNLYFITQRIKTLFDVDSPVNKIDQQLAAELKPYFDYLPGLRIPGIWNNFEAGVRAILGQQMRLNQAIKLLILLIDKLGEEVYFDNQPVRKFFPEPNKISNHSLDFLHIPQKRKETIKRFAAYFATAQNPEQIDDWLTLKGIGNWTVNYVKLRACSNPDVWLSGDSGINKAINKLNRVPNIERTRPWRSYVIFQLWNQLKYGVQR